MDIRTLLAIGTALGDIDSSISPQHDELLIGGPDPDDLTEQQLSELDHLGCRWDPIETCWRVFV